ncbi:MAG: EF-P lysine aminoacylase EpmA [Bdellovibrio sp.]
MFFGLPRLEAGGNNPYMNQALTLQFKVLQSIRDFFKSRDFVDVLTPPMVENPGMEPHIHPFKVVSAYPQQYSQHYLHTSPEFHMKQLLSYGFKKIFTLNYCFRDEPHSRLHRPQFLMLEWYRAGEHYSKIQEDSLELIKFVASDLKNNNFIIDESFLTNEPIIFTIKEAFKNFVSLNLDDVLEAQDFKMWIKSHLPSVPLPSVELSWDDYFFLVFLNEIEPKLKQFPICLLKEYPASMAALSTLKPNDSSVCERFEIYLHGIEVANCYNELTNLSEQRKRFQFQNNLKKELYQYQLPEPKQFYATMQKGLPSSSGIALGVERLIMALTKNEDVFWPSPEEN